MEIDLAVAFWAVSLLFVLIPGADWAYAISAGLRNERVLPAVAGLLTGHVAATLAVAGGVAAVMAGVPLLLTALTAGGAVYLIWLGIGTLKQPSAPYADVGTGSTSLVRQAVKGAFVSGLNPKLLLLFLALLPQFTDPDGAWPVAAQVLGLGLVHVANCAVIYTAVAVGARMVLAARPAAARIVSRVSGAAMVGIGTFLLIEQLVV